MGICTSGNNREDNATHVITPSNSHYISNPKFISSENTNTNTSSGNNQSLTSSPPSTNHTSIRRCNYDKRNSHRNTYTIELTAIKEPFLFPFVFSSNSETNITITSSCSLHSNQYTTNSTCTVGCTPTPCSKPLFQEKPMQPNSPFFTLKLTNNPPLPAYTNSKQFTFKHKNQGHLIVFPSYDIYNEDIYNIMTYTLQIQISGNSFKQIPLPNIESTKSMTEEELITLYLINQVRNNPQKFANEYLNKNDCKELFDCLSNYTAVGSLHEKHQLSKIAMNIVDNTNGVIVKENENAVGSVVKRYVHKPNLYYGVNVHYGKENGYSIVLDMLNDNCLKYTKNRYNILNECFNQIGVCIKRHFLHKHCCVIVFGKDLIER